MGYHWKIVLGSLLLLATIVFPQYVVAQSNSSQEIVSLFELIGTAQKQISDDPEILQKQNIQINDVIFQKNAISEGDQIILPLFSSDSIVAEIKRVSTNVMGTTSITGNIPGEIPGHVFITYKDRRLFGTLHLFDQHRFFNIKSDTKTQEHNIVEKNIEAMEPFVCGGAIIER